MNEKNLGVHLQNLHKLLPSFGCIVIGSGSGGIISVLKSIGLQNVVLIEADQNQIARMYKRNTLPLEYKVENALIYKDDDNIKFYKTSNPSLNCVKSPQEYKKLMPNVSIKDIEMMPSYSLATFLEKKRLVYINWLIVDTYTALDILKYSQESLVNLDVVICRIIISNYDKLSSFMNKNGFIAIKCVEELNPKINICIYVKDYKKKIQIIQEEFTQKLQEQKDNYDKLTELYEQSKLLHQTEIKNLKKQIEQEKIAKQNLLKNIDFDQKILKQIDSYKDNLERTKKEIINAINKQTINTSIQVESFLNIIRYIDSGFYPIKLHKWPLSPDITQFLIEKIELNDYDLVIEFGSGTSTLVIAKALKIHKKKYPSKNIIQVAFEHNKQYYNQTKKILKIENLLDNIQLYHLQLINIEINNQKFKYYDCSKEMEKLSQNKNIKNILVLVDGPPGNTCNQARYPAMYYLTKYFRSHNIDIVLDDYKRAEEKKVVDMWEELLKQKKITYSNVEIETEKGLLFCQITKKERNS